MSIEAKTPTLIAYSTPSDLSSQSSSPETMFIALLFSPLKEAQIGTMVH